MAFVIVLMSEVRRSAGGSEGCHLGGGLWDLYI